MKKSLCFALCIVLIAACAFSSCSLNKNKNKASSDPASSVISIGEESVTLAEYKALFENYLPYMQYNGIDPLESRSSLDSFQDWLVDVLTDDLVTLHQAKQSGFTLTEEQESELETIINRDIDDIADKLTKYAEQDHADDPSVSVETYFEGLVNSESEYYTGVAMSWADYQEYFRTKDRESYIVQAYRQKVCGEFEPTREDAAEWYENALENDRTIYTDSPESYKTDEENYELYFGKKDGVYPVTYVPSGYSRIMQIVVAPAGSLSDEYKAKTARLDELKAMYSELAFEDALNGSDEHSGEIEAILNEYRALKEAADEEYELYVSEAREKIEKAYSELLLGKPFNDVMLRYTEDERVTGGADGEGCEAFRVKGELISLAYSGLDDWSDTVKEEFKKLEKGEFSRVFMDEGCFCIIFYAGDEKPGAVDMDDIYEEIKAVCLAEVQDSQWQELLKEWKKDAALTVDIEAIRKVGEDSLKK